MTYDEYIAYHKQGDAGVEERMIASLCHHFGLSAWDSFRLIYFYTMTYHIPSALAMLLEGERDIKNIKFRTDRRWVGMVRQRFDRMLIELDTEKKDSVDASKTTSQAYAIVKDWYYFNRYSAYLFLEVYINVFSPQWEDDLIPGWEPDENYTKGAESIIGEGSKDELNIFLDNARKDTCDNVFSIETSLCAVEKINKGTRWNGYYTERMLNDADQNPKYRQIIYSLV